MPKACLLTTIVLLVLPAGAQARRPDTTPPTATLTSPTQDATLSGGITVSATATDNRDVDHVTFRVDGVAFASASAAPYSTYSVRYDTTKLSDGSHTFSVRAADTSGNTSPLPDSSATATVQNGSPSPPPPSTGGSYCATRPVGSPIWSDADATAQRLAHPTERIPGNATYNANHPTGTQIQSFRVLHGTFDGPTSYNAAVTGALSGTTDELISATACKYGIDEDTIRAVAVQESDWHQSAVGDLCNGVYTSLGITQVKAPNLAPGCQNGWLGVYPMNRDSTPFNLDFYASRMRECYDGNVNWWSYPAGDLWGCIGWWFSGSWHSTGGNSYANSVKQHLANRDWGAY